MLPQNYTFGRKNLNANISYYKAYSFLILIFVLLSLSHSLCQVLMMKYIIHYNIIYKIYIILSRSLIYYDNHVNKSLKCTVIGTIISMHTQLHAGMEDQVNLD